jgi:hypothetical protein
MCVQNKKEFSVQVKNKPSVRIKKCVYSWYTSSHGSKLLLPMTDHIYCRLVTVAGRYLLRVEKTADAFSYIF